MYSFVAKIRNYSTVYEFILNYAYYFFIVKTFKNCSYQSSQLAIKEFLYKLQICYNG